MDSSKTSITWSRPLGLWLAPALLLALGMAAILTDSFGIETGVSDRLFDAYQRHAARPFSDTAGMPVRVLELPSLDEDSLVKAARALSAQGVAMIVLAAPMQPGPSPQSLAARLPPGSDAARAALAKLPEPGHDLAAAIADAKAVVPVMLGLAGREPHIKARFVYRGTSDPFALVPRFDAAAAPPALLETNAAGSAAANLTPDGDGVVRRMPLAFRVGAALVPGMAAEVLRVAAGKPDITVVSSEHDPLSFLAGVGIAALETQNGQVPTDAGGQIRLRYAANASERMLNPDAPNLNDSRPLQSAIVVVGAAGQMARTPLGPASATTIIAESIENLIGNTVLSRPGWAQPLEALILAALGTAMITLLRFGLGWAAALVMAGALLLGLGSWYLYTAHNLLLDAATPALFLGLAFAAGALAWIQDLRLAYAGLRMAFSDSLPRAAIEKIARRPHLLKLEGETRTVTYLVCGVRGLAGLAADFKNDAAGFTSLMQRALTPLIDQALAHGGTIDRLTADGFAAFWNAPLDDADHALHACEAAHGMAVMAARVNEHIAVARGPEDKVLAPLEIGIGIASGLVI